MAALRHATVAAPQIVLIGQRLPGDPASGRRAFVADRSAHATRRGCPAWPGPDLFDSDARIDTPCNPVELLATIFRR